VIDLLEAGLGGSKAVPIITTVPRPIIEEIKEELARTCTDNEIHGGYTDITFIQITCVINRLEEQKRKAMVSETDPHAFVAIYDVSEVKKGEFVKQDLQKR